MDSIAGKSLDNILLDFASLKDIPELSEIVTSFLDGEYKKILKNPTSQTLYAKLAATVTLSKEEQDVAIQEGLFNNQSDIISVFISGLAAFNAFLQANVTGPPLDLRDVFSQDDANTFRDQCLRSLDIDGVSVYQHIPHIELFCLARLVFTTCFPRLISGTFTDSKWMRLRINAYHQRLLSGVSFSRITDATALQNVIDKDLKELEAEIFAPSSTFATEAKVQFLLEKAQIHIMQGLDIKAKEDVKSASETSGFSFALSGALGKRTRFQQTDISQLVVFARSKDVSEEIRVENGDGVKDLSIEDEDHKGPQNLEHNDDTLLEDISFAKPQSDAVDNLPPALAGMLPDQQPQLTPLDQITLLTEATIKDTFLPLDKLNSEEVLPYAIRVLNDKPTNWQIYTQALLVRSRIESHRSRTQERSVLQLQVIVDQIIADTTEEPSPSADGVPEIRVTSFLPRAKASESAPITERLQYIFQLNTPTRWEIETELAFAWSSAGSLVSALEIFKRLKLWPEVALCHHSVGQEDKARQIVRRQLYYSEKGPDMDVYDVDAEAIATEKWEGEIRSPPPPHSPRLWCILGDLDNDPTCWQRAWEISHHRYARAQRTLGEYYARKGDLALAREAYMAATVVNRQNNATWSRLGDIDLAVGNWDGAIIAFQQSIMIDDSDAKTYSNLGSALLSKHAELTTLTKIGEAAPAEGTSPADILRQSLAAYKRAAALAYSNWQIWDNVLTIATRMKPPAYPEILLALRNVIRIRAPTMGENAVDIDVLRALVGEVTSRSPPSTEGVYDPPRGSLAKAVIGFYKDEVEPLITTRSTLWVLAEKLALYVRDYARALSCAEKAWRMASKGEWEGDVEAWREVVELTDGLVSAYENYGGREWEGGVVEKGWKGKARSAVRGVMGRGRDAWEGTEEWGVLEGLLEGLKG
ncbi:TPR-like protein [Glarea lozoyensis ATCC 20868]|uniref:TPR-like protein n=1 Tax=Glarea lozoyensis (strain ATCC 20868 / MF5171) TaxID=1116229 RepID=S3DDI6_GLAL2|nr:TPR-like protein [Glarea lozoyensis ATCC 20868]EPE35770.1 TPR-like protein [Glarea lozoyensis ATCC 20868]